MKTSTFFSSCFISSLGILFLAMIISCNKIPKRISPVTQNLDSIKCYNTVSAALITPTNLQSILNASATKKIYLQFKTNDDHNFYAAAYAGAFPYTDVTTSFNPLTINPPFLPKKPYIFGNVEWKFPQNFQANASLQYYCLIPAMADDNTHVTFSYLEIPSKFPYSDTTFTVDSAFVANSDSARLDSLASYANKSSTATGGASLNPVPPKKPL